MKEKPIDTMSERECILSSLSIEAIANLQIVELVQLRIA